MAALNTVHVSKEIRSKDYSVTGTALLHNGSKFSIQEF